MKQVLSKEQKQYILDDLFQDEEIHADYEKKLDKEWYISDDKSLDPEGGDPLDLEVFPFVLMIDDKFADALGASYIDNLIKVTKLINLKG